MSVKSLLVAGTVAAGLSVSAFCLPVSAATTTITTAELGTLCADDGMGGVACTLTSGDYKLGEDIDLGNGYITIADGATVTLDLNGHSITTMNYQILAVGNATLTINGNGTVNGSTHINEGATVVINGGTFLADGPSAVYVMSVADPVSLTINGGTFTSEYDFGIEIESETDSNISLAGGTFSGGSGAIAVWGTADDLRGLLADGYIFSGEHIEENTNMGLSILLTSPVTVSAEAATPEEPETPTATTGGTTPQTGGYGTVNEGNVISDSKKAAMEEMGKGMEEVIAKATSNGSTKKSAAKTATPKAPDTGVVDGAVAASGTTVLTMASLAGAAIVAKKRF